MSNLDEGGPLAMVEQLDFSTMSLRDALELAEAIEEEARDRYQELAEQLLLHNTKEAAAFFCKMVDAEEIHRAQLAERRQSLFGAQPKTLALRFSLEVETPDYDDARAFMTVQQALEIALLCENRAHQFFTRAIPRVQDPQARALFEALRDEEAEHQEMVMAQLRRAPLDPGVAEDYADEPAAQ